MLTFKKFLVIALTLLLSACTSTKMLQTQGDQQSQYINTSAASIEYRIQPQDRLQVVIYNDPQQSAAAIVQGQGLAQTLNKKGILVDASGNISMPLIGRVHVAGLTQSQAAKKIERRYRKYIKTPSVYVEAMNKRLFVLGEVKKPGVVTIDKEKMTLFEAIAHAGGFKDSAVKNNIIILSKEGSNSLALRRVDLTNFDTMNYGSLMLRPNDVVYVQPNEWKEFKVNSDNVTSIFKSVGSVLSPFATIKYLSD